MNEKPLDTYRHEREERHRAYLNTRLLRDEFPRIEQLTLQLSFGDASGPSSYSAETRTFAPAATAFFAIPCPSSACMGGGFDLGSVIWKLIGGAGHETSGRLDCQGRDSTDERDPHYCPVQLHYRVTVAYAGPLEAGLIPDRPRIMWKRFGTADDRIELTEYSPEWPAAFDAESERIRAICGPALVAIEHIGSTALPGIAAKPVLDLMLGVARLEDADGLVAPMRALGYEYAGRYEVFGRFSFVLRMHGRRVAHAHGFVLDGVHWRRHLFFRDHLRSHPEAAACYESLKRKLAARYEGDRDAYSDGKTPFLRSIEALAL